MNAWEMLNGHASLYVCICVCILCVYEHIVLCAKIQLGIWDLEPKTSLGERYKRE